MLKLIIKYVMKVMLHVFFILPVNRKKFYFRVFGGTRYACNPKYLYLWLVKNNFDFSYVWELNHPVPLERNTVRVSSFHSLRAVFHMMTSRFIVTNGAFPWWIPLRRSQVVLETWHGGGAYKRVGIYEKKPTAFFDFEQKKNSMQATFYISSCKKFTEIQSVSKCVLPEKFICTGMPRNAILFDYDTILRLKSHVRNDFKVSNNAKIVLYAPTYRGATGFKTNESQGNPIELDFTKLVSALKTSFGGEWLLFYRSHYFDQYLKNSLPDFVIDATKYEDMQELLCAADVLVTDYSSSMWDFALTGKPCFLYAPDIDKYMAERGFYTDPATWPFPLARSEDALWENIARFDGEKYAAAVRKHLEDLGSYENKEACRKVCEAIGVC